MIEVASLTRPNNTTAYAQSDLIANSETAGQVAPLEFGSDGSGFRAIRQARLHKSGANTTNATFQLWLLSARPTVTNGDNGAIAGNWSESVVGVLEGSTVFAASDGVVGFLDAPNNVAPLGVGKLYGLLEARGAYTPAAEEVFTLTLELTPGRNV